MSPWADDSRIHSGVVLIVGMRDAIFEMVVEENRSLRSESEAAKPENAVLVERVDSLVSVVTGLKKAPRCELEQFVVATIV